MLRARSSLLFALILGLSFALLVWWTTFQVLASRELAAASEALSAADIGGAVRALGGNDPHHLHTIADRRRMMFASEGVFFALVLLGSGWLYVLSLRREAESRHAQDRFLAGATHELKTPLATIRLLLESLRDDRVPAEKRANWLGTGLLEAERLDRGLDNVLTAAGLRTTARRPPKELGDLATDVQVAVDAVRGRALASNIAMTVSSPPPTPWTRDGAAMQLVLRNLLDNAIKYSTSGGRVDVAVTAADGNACIVVSDEGRGLEEQELAHAFDAFWRGTDVATGGAGLGLHLVRQLVQAHGGTVDVASPGRARGSTFTVKVPIGGQP